MAVADSNGKDQNTANVTSDELLPVGAQLKLAREKAGLSLGDVCTALLITKKRLTALESDDYEHLPAKVFVIGYIKKYAALLQLDGKHLVEVYEVHCSNMAPDEESFVVPDLSAKIKLGENIFGNHQAPPKWVVPAVVFGLAFFVLFIIMFFTGDKEPERLKAPEKIKTIVDEIVVEHTEIDAAVLVERPDDDTENEDIESTVEKELLGSAAIEQKKIDTLFFSFVEECWLNVKEVEGNVIYSGIAAAGSTVTLEGRGPFELMVGNASAASLLVNGELVSIEPQPGRKTAKLSVGG